MDGHHLPHHQSPYSVTNPTANTIRDAAASRDAAAFNDNVAEGFAPDSAHRQAGHKTESGASLPSTLDAQKTGNRDEDIPVIPISNRLSNASQDEAGFSYPSSEKTAPDTNPDNNVSADAELTQYPAAARHTVPMSTGQDNSDVDGQKLLIPDKRGNQSGYGENMAVPARKFGSSCLEEKDDTSSISKVDNRKAAKLVAHNETFSDCDPGHSGIAEKSNSVEFSNSSVAASSKPNSSVATHTTPNPSATTGTKPVTPAAASSKPNSSVATESTPKFVNGSNADCVQNDTNYGLSTQSVNPDITDTVETLPVSHISQGAIRTHSHDPSSKGMCKDRGTGVDEYIAEPTVPANTGTAIDALNATSFGPSVSSDVGQVAFVNAGPAIADVNAGLQVTEKQKADIETIGPSTDDKTFPTDALQSLAVTTTSVDATAPFKRDGCTETNRPTVDASLRSSAAAEPSKSAVPEESITPDLPQLQSTARLASNTRCASDSSADDELRAGVTEEDVQLDSQGNRVGRANQSVKASAGSAETPLDRPQNLDKGSNRMDAGYNDKPYAEKKAPNKLDVTVSDGGELTVSEDIKASDTNEIRHRGGTTEVAFFDHNCGIMATGSIDNASLKATMSPDHVIAVNSGIPEVGAGKVTGNLNEYATMAAVIPDSVAGGVGAEMGYNDEEVKS